MRFETHLTIEKKERRVPYLSSRVISNAQVKTQEDLLIYTRYNKNTDCNNVNAYTTFAGYIYRLKTEKVYFYIPSFSLIRRHCGDKNCNFKVTLPSKIPGYATYTHTFTYTRKCYIACVHAIHRRRYV